MGNLEEGLAAFDAQEYHRAFTVLKPLAEQGIAEAQCCIGCIYQFGFGREIDVHAAIYWHKLASAQGYGPSSDNLGSIFTFGWEDVPEDREKGREYYALARDQGCVF